MMMENYYHDDRTLPTFTLRQIDLPEILQWQVGGKYYVLMKVEMTGLRNMKELNSREDKSKVEADFQVQSIRAVGDKPIDPTVIEKKEFEDMVAKVKSGEY